jgi:UPF0176 protein
VPDFQILLYYNYTTINQPELLMEEQRQLCQKLGLKGRIIIAPEGINGTVEGETGASEQYAMALLADSRFSATHIKRSLGTGQAFPKLSIKVRSEIVSMHLEEDVNPNQIAGKHLLAEELHSWFEQAKEFYIVDMRNDYEQEVGQFEGSILPGMGNFRDLPALLDRIDHLRDKVIVTVCTGGVRCEKASGFLVKHGFKNVYQLFGGIVSYMEKYPNQHFLGKLYVFDQRVIMGFNIDAPEHIVIGRCFKCGQPSEQYVNCANNMCHLHFICCQDCHETEASAFCSQACVDKIAITKVPIGSFSTSQ